MSVVTVGAPRQYVDRGWLAVSAPITIQGRRLDVYYRFSQGPLSPAAGSFALNAVAPAMKLGLPLHIETPVSTQFLRLLARTQAFMPNAHPYLHEVAVEAAALPSTGAPAALQKDQRGVALFFSGGVDSFYSLLTRRAEITHLIFVHGFDTMLTSPAIGARNVQAMRQAAAELNKPMIEVETNFRRLLDTYEPWSHHTATAAQVAIALLLAPQFRRVYIAENYDYFGERSMSDALHGFGTDGVEVVLDGTYCLRSNKTAYIAESETALRWLRVCWQNKELAYNCGRCEKCLRTMIALHLAGALSRCRTFDRPIDVERVRYLDLDEGAYFWPELLHELERSDDQPDLTEAVRESLRWATIPDTMWPRILAALESRCNQPALTQVVGHLLRQYQQDSAEQRQQMQRLRKAIARVSELERELTIIKQSRSWMLTAPLRAAGRILKQHRPSGTSS